MKSSTGYTFATLLPILLLFSCASVDKTFPDQDNGPKADSLAQKIMQISGYDEWQETAIISWTFADRNKHIWDRQRKYSRVEWDKTIVMFDHTTKQGKAWKDGEPIEGQELAELIDKAWNDWANDSFWLNPFEKLYDEGTERAYVNTEDGNDALLITYTSGGNTPGDSYLWIVDENGLPTAVKMWVSIIPIKGVEFSWEEWQTLETGAKTAGLHQLSFLKLRLTDVKAASSVVEFSEEDPFSEL